MTQRQVECEKKAAVEKKIVEAGVIDQTLNQLLEHRTAGSPDDVDIVFTDLSPHQLSQQLKQLGTPASSETIRQWMKQKSCDCDVFIKQLVVVTVSTGTSSSSALLS